MTRIAILDYGMGNLRSVEKALERVGAQASITQDPGAVRAADGLILPGVGAFPAAMRRVRELELDALVAERLSAGTPVLGICLGLQLLLERSSEQGGEGGLGLMPGEVAELEAPGLKLPHIGWEPVRWERSSELTEGLATETPFYFVHSFAVRPSDRADVLGTAEWGERFVCAVAHPPLYGVQFHPEKSSAAGLRLLANFTEICAFRASDEVADRANGPTAPVAPEPGGSAVADEHAAGR
jgi:imidazole glycerol-phosphate synthase subunit HisH